ncbi:hypothetical protein EJ05DRAFT_498756 [Pseudovirgaria hyperparasitica]|uniref:Uncharacterized protein n=1 Tax=Pseudovirgaria hyperparasitica TaxID=470096 RepID=A0A6A6WDA7_9PEZI|nr:uncharacterized protein EJ05DRAFT_498756 [Pseudovirgaria hyperparasitica]KAF2759547.1 hypothetical protein EJ05DRAFT_498756 [Pseudovirgaria hyperparasitica]
MSPMRLEFIVPVACIVMMGLLGVVQLGLNADVLAWSDRNEDDRYLRVKVRTSRNGWYSSVVIAFRAIPDSYSGTSSGLIFWSSIGAIVDTVLLLVLTLRKRSFIVERSDSDKNVSHRSLPIKPIVYTILTVVFLRPLIVLLYIFIYHYTQATRTLAYLDLYNLSNTHYPASEGTFTPETWFCGIRSHVATVYPYGHHERNELSRLCNEARTTRWILLPMLVVSMLVVFGVLWMQRSASARAARNDGEAVDVHRDRRTSDADTMKERSEDLEHGTE